MMSQVATEKRFAVKILEKILGEYFSFNKEFLGRGIYVHGSLKKNFDVWDGEIERYELEWRLYKLGRKR